MNAITIQGTELQVKEYKGHRVVTFKDVDQVHQRPEGTAKRNFNANRTRFISGVDFFKVSANEIRTHKITDISPKVQEPLTLVTETGYLMLVKSFTDDLAWKVQRDLVDTYFRSRITPDEESIRGALDSGVPTLVVDTDKLIKCAEIMAGCLDGNRMYVLNILKNLIPEIDGQQIPQITVDTPEGPQALPDASEKVVVKRKVPQGVPMDVPKMLAKMQEQGMTVEELARKANVSIVTVGNWITGKNNPVLQNRINVCAALGVDENFLTPPKKRRVKE